MGQYTSRLRKKGIPQPALSLSSLPVGREVKESSHLLPGCGTPTSSYCQERSFFRTLLVYCPISLLIYYGADAADFFEDGIGGSGPDEGTAFGVVVGDEVIDLLDQFADVFEGAAADGALGNQGEPALDLIKPTGIGGSEVQVIARVTGQPGFNLGMFVGGVIVQESDGGRGRWGRCGPDAGENSGTPDDDGVVCTA